MSTSLRQIVIFGFPAVFTCGTQAADEIGGVPVLERTIDDNDVSYRRHHIQPFSTCCSLGEGHIGIVEDTFGDFGNHATNCRRTGSASYPGPFYGSRLLQSAPDIGLTLASVRKQAQNKNGKILVNIAQASC